MGLMALDLLRILGWGLVNFIYSIIDTLFEILKSLNAFDIISSVSNNNTFSKFYTGVFAISLTLLGLFSIWKFLIKILNPEEELNTSQIVKEIVKCTTLILCSTFLFVECSSFSNKLSGYVSNIFDKKDLSISNNMMYMYISFSEGYLESDEYIDTNIKKLINTNEFTNKKLYNQKYVTSERWILPNEKDYVYEINWIMLIVVGAFFLYSLFFCGMMLAKRQIEFLFLFVISPVVFATSIGNKQRRGAVIEQLVSLMLQSVVLMLIISLITLVIEEINATTFFSNSIIKDILIKSLLYIGCGTFLLTGSQVINKFVGVNVSANNGREQFMAMVGFNNVLKSGTSIIGKSSIGAGLVGMGATSSLLGKVGGNKLMNKIGNSISKFGSNISNNTNSNSVSKFGSAVSKFGNVVANDSLSKIGKIMRKGGYESMGSALNQVMPSRNMYRRRFGDKR